MVTWNKVRKRILEREENSASWHSDQKHLLEIIAQARKWKLDPTTANEATISALRNIVPSARKAISMHDRLHLAQLFDWACYMPMAQLRVALGQTQREDIYFHAVEPEGYRVTLTPRQFERVRQTNKHRWQFKPRVLVEVE